MAILGKKRYQIEEEQKKAEEMLSLAVTKGLDIQTHTQALEQSKREYEQKNWDTSLKILRELLSRMSRDIQHHDNHMLQQNMTKQQVHSMISRIKDHLHYLDMNHVKIQIRQFEELLISYEKGEIMNLTPKLFPIEYAFATPYYSPKKAWTYNVDEKVRALIMNNGKIIIGSLDNNVYFLNNRGNLIWKHSTGGSVKSIITIGEFVVAGSQDKHVYCFTDQGKLMWKFPTGGTITQVIPYGDKIICGSADKHIYCLDLNGYQLWKYKSSGPILSLCQIGYSIIATTKKMDVYCITHTGSLSWKKITERRIISLMNIGNYFISRSEDRELYCSDFNGNLVWRKELDAIITAVYYIGGRLIAGTQDNNLHCLDVNGDLLWSYDTEDIVRSIFGYQDLIIFGTADKKLHCIDIHGKFFWKKQLRNIVQSIYIDSNLIIAQAGNRIIAFDLSIIPVLLSIGKDLDEGRKQYTNLFEAEQVFELGKKAFSNLDIRKCGKLLTKVKESIKEQKETVKKLELRMKITKPDVSLLDKAIETEYRENVKKGLADAKRTILGITGMLSTLLGKKANIESILSKQKNESEILSLMDDYSYKLKRAKSRNRNSLAKSYAFMIVNQKRNLQIRENLKLKMKNIDEQVHELSEFSKDIFDNAKELPFHADLVGAFGILNNEAINAITDANDLVGEINEIENELNRSTLETDLASAGENLDIEKLHEDVRAEVEKELEG